MLRIVIACLALAFAAPHGAAAQETLAPNPAIEGVIANQFEAFRRGDIERAWQYASPNIQGLFRTPENFGAMVENGYPMVWRPGQVRFLDLQTLGGVIVQRVEVVGPDGTLHVLGYAMVRTPGGWQINGVQILRAPDVGA